MGIQDRDWYRDAYREREKALNAEAHKRDAAAARTRPELARLINKRKSNGWTASAIAKGAALLIALCLATYGLLALIRDFR